MPNLVSEPEQWWDGQQVTIERQLAAKAAHHEKMSKVEL